MAAGSTHCLALTEDSEVHSWGNNDQCQHFDTLHQTKPEPSLLPGLDTKHIVGIACGPAQVLRVAAPGTCGMLVLRCPLWCVETPWASVCRPVSCAVSHSRELGELPCRFLERRPLCFVSSVCATRLFPMPPALARTRMGCGVGGGGCVLAWFL